MERRIEADVEGWPTRPFEDGYDGLRQLASADFSGVVRAGGTWLFFVNGKIVGVFEGEIENVEGAQGTAHKAPHPSLPLLYAMQTEGGDTRAKYYTNDTPISEVDDTLSSGSFTGYVELSENVLSGDYYQLYHGGRSMSVAFVGNSGKMITGEEAFERADDEVGIYEVVDVDVEVTDVPSPEGAGEDAESGDTDDAGESDADAGSIAADSDSSDVEAADEGTGGASGGTAAENDAADDAGDEAGDSTDGATTSAAGTTATSAEDDSGSTSAATSASDDEPPTETESATEAATTTEAGTDHESATGGNGADAGAERSAAGERDAGTATAATADSSATESPSEDDATASASPGDGASGRRANSGATRSAADDARSSRSTQSSRSARSSGARADSTDEDGSPRQSEAAWREATTVPSLDPDRSEDEPAGAQSRTQTNQRRTGSTRQSRQQSRAQSSQQSQRRSREESRSEPRQPGSSTQRSTSTATGDVDDTLEQEVLEREDRMDRLQQRVENLRDERDEVAEERDRLEERVESLTEENESLRSEIRELEQEVEELEAVTAAADAASEGDSGDAGAAGGAMAPRVALEGTDLFVRYGSKSAPTLEAAHDGSADAKAVNENLRLDVHTQFEDEGVTVNGEPFDAFLRETMAYRFVEWLVRVLPYEIRETDSATALQDLYDALPEIDRVEFHGKVARDALEDEEGAPSETFDVVVRDKMGEALFVANMNDARDPATGRMIVDLQEAASRVKEHSMALASAFFVTRSFFEPAALETASEATSGSLLSRDSRASYVKLSRKSGYHLCLVEARGDDLHLNVPEL